MASVTLLRNLIKKYRIGSKTAPAAPASAKESIAKQHVAAPAAETKHAAFPEFKNQDSDDEKPLQFSRTKANVVGPSQSASKHKGFPKYKGWDSDDEEPLQIPRVKHVTAPPQHHDTHRHTKSLGSLLQKPKKETSGILPKGNKYGYPQSEFSDASDSDAPAVDDAHAAASVAAAPVASVAANVPKLESPVDDPAAPAVASEVKRAAVPVVKKPATKWDDLEIAEDLTGGPATTIKPIPTKFYEAPEPDITEPINMEHPSIWGAPPTAEEKAEMTVNENLASEGKEWYDSGDLVVDVGEFKGAKFDAPEIALEKAGKAKDKTYHLNLDPTAARDFGNDKKNADMVKSLYYQYKLATDASKMNGISHYVVNGKPIVAVRNFTKMGEGNGQKTNTKTIAAYLNEKGISSTDARGIQYGKVLKGTRSEFIVIGITEKPPKYNFWKATMKSKFGAAADILP